MKFDVILADPPWQFLSRAGGSMKSGADAKYPTLTVDEMAKLPIGELAKDDAFLFMWWVGSQPEEAIRLVKAWGFTLKTMTGFVWVKKTKLGKPFFGMGFTTRAGSECCLIATKGKPKRVDGGVRSVVEAPNLKHSSKPVEVHKRIQRLAGAKHKVELFGREKRENWVVLGDEIDGEDIRDSVPALIERERGASGMAKFAAHLSARKEMG